MSVTNDKLEELTKLFNIFDKDKDGYLSYEEYAEIMKLLSIDIKTSYDSYICDTNYKMDLKEFHYNYSQQVVQEQILLEELKEAFKIIDQNKDSYINAEDFRYFMNTLGDEITIEECEELIEDVSFTSKNQTKPGMNFDEFVDVIKGISHKK